ncbi:hypothetical protein MetMK1DRAFT_00007430 [Metallosphaera yellowstonensis MK1]|uniref:Uncharacterized protein n=1 Tax=Metallosphaera yellowstonensis MK1 TaxID=671065 RepID=H2C1X0_9CREN|nr:hypothetical protein MetMK1DRAFT_00007430 [Metallosphaera yellowstonensis MK1]
MVTIIAQHSLLGLDHSSLKYILILALKSMGLLQYRRLGMTSLSFFLLKIKMVKFN